MVDSKLLAREHLDDEEWSLTPHPDHLVPDEIEYEQTSAEFRSELADDPAAAVITHLDADGYSSAALLAAATGEDIVVQPVGYHGAYGLEDALDDVRRVPEADQLYITDMNPDEDRIVSLVDGIINDEGIPVTWYDHHQWDSNRRHHIEAAGVDLVVDTEECTASLLERELDYDFSPEVQDLAACTRDIDLWIREDDRSPRLNVFATIAEPEEYIETVLEHGADLPPDAASRVDERLERNEALERAAVERADVHSVGHGERAVSVAITYVRGGRSSEIGNHLAEVEGYDVAIIQKPHGGVGIYSHSNRKSFARCHEVAGKLGGGGHPTAAGCEVPIDTFRELARYWSLAGESHRSVLLNAVRDVVNGGEDS